jgi:hypothetical protein
MEKEFRISGQINQTSENGDIINSYTGSVFVDKSNGKQPTNKSEKEGKPTKENNWLYSMLKSNWFLIGIIIILLGWIGFLHCQTVINPNNVTLILSFVGILATFVIVGNYAQVKEIENGFNRKIIKLEKGFADSIQKSINNYNQTVSAVVHQLGGIHYMGLHEKDPDIALKLFVEAINDLNDAKNKEPLEGIVEYIEELIEGNCGLIQLSDKDKKKYIEICKKSSESKRLLKQIKQLRVLQSNARGDNIQGINVEVNK